MKVKKGWWLISIIIMVIIIIYYAFSKNEKIIHKVVKKETFITCDNKGVLKSVNNLLMQYFCDSQGCDSRARIGAKILYVENKQLNSNERICSGKAVIVDKAGNGYIGIVGYFDYKIKKVKVIKGNDPQNGYVVNLYPYADWAMISGNKSKEIFNRLKKEKEIKNGENFAF